MISESYRTLLPSVWGRPGWAHGSQPQRSRPPCKICMPTKIMISQRALPHHLPRVLILLNIMIVLFLIIFLMCCVCVSLCVFVCACVCLREHVCACVFCVCPCLSGSVYVFVFPCCYCLSSVCNCILVQVTSTTM